MAVADRILQLKLISDTTSLQKDMSKVQGKTSKVSSGFKKLGAVIGGLAIADMGFDILKQGIDDMLEADKAARELDRSLKSLGQRSPKNLKKIERATQRALSVNFDDTEYVKGLTGLMDKWRFDVPKAIRIFDLAIDLQASRGGDAATWANTLSKALDGNVKALRELGFSKGAAKHLSNLQILRRLEKRYGQAAEDNANTLPGKWKQIETQFGEFVEDMVTKAFNFAQDFGKNFKDLTGGQDLQTEFQIFQGIAEQGMVELGNRIATGGVGVTAQALLLGQHIFEAITGQTALIPDAVGEDVHLTEEQLNQINAGQFRQRVIAEINRVKSAMNALPVSAEEMVHRLEAVWKTWRAPGFFGTIAKFLRWPNIFGMAEGGIVDRPTLAMIGERGPEAVVPLSGSGAGGWGGVTVNVYAGVGDPVEIGRQVERVLRAYRGRAGSAAA